MPDLKVQLADYLDHVVERVVVDDIFEERIGTPPVQPVRLRPAGQRPSRGWIFAAAAAAVVLLLVGGWAWLAATDRDRGVVDQPATTVAPEINGQGAGGVIELDRVIPPRVWGTNRIAAAHGAIWVGADETDFTTGVQPGALFRIDAVTREVTHEVDVPAGVIDIVGGSDAVWALLANDTVVRIDPTSGRVTDTVAAGLGIDGYDASTRSDLAIAEGALWIAGPRGAVRLDLQTLDAVEVTLVDSEDGSAAIDMWLGESRGVLWGWRSHRGDAAAIDIATTRGEFTKVVDGPETNATLAEGAVWSFDGRGLARLDTSSMEITRFGNEWLPGDAGWSFAVIGGAVWTVGSGHVARFDPDLGQVTSRVALGGDDSQGQAWPVVVADGDLWVVGGLAPTLIQIDPASGEAVGGIDVSQVGDPAPFDPPWPGGDLAAAGETLWLASPTGTIMWVDRTAMQSGSITELSPGPVPEMPQSDVMSMVEDYFDAFNAGDIDRLLRLFAGNPSFSNSALHSFGLVDEQPRLEYLMAQAAILAAPDCRFDDLGINTVVCMTGILDAPSQAIGAPAVPTTMLFRVTPAGISQIGYRYPAPGGGSASAFADIGEAFEEWATEAHPEARTPDADSPYRDPSWEGDSVHGSPDQARRNGELVARYAQEWSESLAARGCFFPDPCYMAP